MQEGNTEVAGNKVNASLERLEDYQAAWEHLHWAVKLLEPGFSDPIRGDMVEDIVEMLSDQMDRLEWYVMGGR